MTRRVFLVSVFITVVLGGCATNNAPVEDRFRDVPTVYRVKRGDNLIRIAFQYDLDFRDIAQWNNLASPDLILAGQDLRLRPPDYQGEVQVATAPAPTPNINTTPAPPRPATPPANAVAAAEPGVTRNVRGLSWGWPTTGAVVRTYSPNIPGRKGIQIAGDMGQTVRATSPGQVVYSGSGLPGYGRLIIVKHSDTFLSAYGYLGEIFVKEGDRVASGQDIARLGTSNDNRAVLHFEIRQNGKPVNPLQFLPS